MRFFESLIADGKDKVFYQLPLEFTKNSDKEILRYCVGAALYMPATRPMIAQEIIAQKHPACTTIVLDLEDALGDLQVAEGERQLVQTLTEIQLAIQNNHLHITELPLLFVRVRSFEQLEQLTEQLGDLQHVLTGYVFPKFVAQQGEAYLQHIVAQNARGYQLYAMPILESREILLKEGRMQELLALRQLFERFEQVILNVRIGTTDFCGTLGLRRSIHQTVYDLVAIRDCLADIMNIFLRDDSPFILSGPVWEYFGTAQAIEGLLYETTQDSFNGLIGKTIIHPTHLLPVQAVYSVTHEDFSDAERIIQQSHGEIGVEKSFYGNKMNEMKPHFVWAKRTLLRAQVYGVLQQQASYKDLLKGQVVV